MTGDPLDPHTHFGFRRNISTNTGPSVSAYSEYKEHTSVGLVSRFGYHQIVVLSSRFPRTTPGDTSLLYHLAKRFLYDAQDQRCDLDWSETPHDLNASFLVVRQECWASCLGAHKWISLIAWAAILVCLERLESRMSRIGRWKGRLQRGIDKDDCRLSCSVER